MKNRFLTTLSVLALSTAITGYAAPKADAAVFTSRSAFDAATSGLTTIDFNNTTTAMGFTAFGSPATISGTDFASFQLFTVGPAAPFLAGTVYGSDYLEWQANTGIAPLLTITFPSAVTAFGFDFTELRGNVALYEITAGTDTFDVSAAANAGSFFGETLTIPITSINVSVTAGFHGTLDNLTFEGPISAQTSVASVPEPASMALLGISLIGTGVMARRRRQLSTTPAPR